MDYDTELVKCYFLENDINLQSDLYVSKNTIVSKYSENYIPGILLKSISGMNFCNTYYTFDYMVRTNLSSVYHIPRLLNMLQDRSTTEFIGGEVDIQNSYFPFELDHFKPCLGQQSGLLRHPRSGSEKCLPGHVQSAKRLLLFGEGC